MRDDIKEYKSRHADREAREQRKKNDQEQARYKTLSFIRHPDKIIKYTGYLQLYTLILTVATAALVIATIVTATILNSTDEKIGKQAAETHSLAIAAKAQADLMDHQISVMQGQLEEMRLDRRAWIVPHLVKLLGVPAADQMLDFFFTYGNTGREPALNVGYNSNSWSMPIDVIGSAVPATATDALKKAIDARLTDTCDVAKQNENLSLLYPTSPDGDSSGIKVDPRWITQPIIDRGFVVAEGCFVYRSVGKIHKSRFCFFWNKIIDGFRPPEARGYMSTCPTGNEAD